MSADIAPAEETEAAALEIFDLLFDQKAITPLEANRLLQQLEDRANGHQDVQLTYAKGDDCHA